MSNYEDITELEVNTKEKSKWWEEEQVAEYHHPGLDYKDYVWSDIQGVDNW